MSCSFRSRNTSAPDRFTTSTARGPCSTKSESPTLATPAYGAIFGNSRSATSSGTSRATASRELIQGLARQRCGALTIDLSIRRQLRVDDLLELFDGLRAREHVAVDEERGRAVHAGLVTGLLIGVDGV